MLNIVLVCMLLIGGCAGDAGGDDTIADGVELFVGGLEESRGGRLAVDGVDHHLLRLDLFDSLKPGGDVFVARVVDGFTPTFAAHEHGLDDDVAIINIYGVDGIKFQDVVVHPHQGIVNGLAVDHRGIAQHGDLCHRTVLIAQTDGVVDDLCEVGMTGGLAITGKGQHVCKNIV